MIGTSSGVSSTHAIGRDAANNATVPATPRMTFVQKIDEKRAPLAASVNSSVPLATVGGPTLSAALPFTLTENLRAAVGENLVTLYTSGACGDLNHVDVT